MDLSPCPTKPQRAVHVGLRQASQRSRPAWTDTWVHESPGFDMDRSKGAAERTRITACPPRVCVCTSSLTQFDRPLRPIARRGAQKHAGADPFASFSREPYIPILRTPQNPDATIHMANIVAALGVWGIPTFRLLSSPTFLSNQCPNRSNGPSAQLSPQPSVGDRGKQAQQAGPKAIASYRPLRVLRRVWPRDLLTQIDCMHTHRPLQNTGKQRAVSAVRGRPQATSQRSR